MLDATTKAKIDSARDILVGKVPDPKSQVEQITIALIYKFMDDMDRQSEELGGKASFFTGGFKKYRWAQLLDKRYSGHERLLLYAEGIEKMNENKNIPQLFRDIFRGVFLPYRDPETLNLFLKEIDGFSYDHSERLGDAFEYLLSVLGTQGDAGQFRTPRHIIDFIVAVVDPKKNETILDPACGTAGFLISAFKHILRTHDPSDPPDRSDDRTLTPDERAQLMANFRGYDIAPDMVRLARANMYLHGFPNPTINEYDALTSEERWDERCDVILANPPFMTPKGGIRPHNRFSIKAKRSEVLFVDYIAEHLNPGGRAGVIVPEGIIFQSQNAYKALRKMLVENYLWAVVSLPAGVFNPYSGVKTSILFLDRGLVKSAGSDGSVLFVKIENDGFDLGAQRRPIAANDLPAALKALLSWRARNPSDRPDQPNLLAVPRKKLLESPDINFSGDRYRAPAVRPKGKWPMVKLGDDSLFEVVAGGTPTSSNPAYWDGDVRWATLVDLPAAELVSDLRDTARRITAEGLKNSAAILLPKRSILVSTRATIGRIAISQVEVATNQGFKNVVIKDFTRANEKFVAYALTQLVSDMQRMASGGTFKELSKTNFAHLEIPLPPLAVQGQIVAELEGYRKVIEGARQILAAYKPTLRIDPQWPVVKLGEVLKLASGDFLPEKNRRLGYHQVYGGNGVTGSHDHYNVERPTIVIGRVGAYCGAVHVTEPKAWITDNALYVTAILKPCQTEYLAESLRVLNLNQFAKVGGQPSISQASVLEQQIPLPPLSVQRQIVAELEAERKLVEANRELIARMEAKIKAKLAEVWGEESTSDPSDPPDRPDSARSAP